MTAAKPETASVSTPMEAQRGAQERRIVSRVSLGPGVAVGSPTRFREGTLYIKTLVGACAILAREVFDERGAQLAIRDGFTEALYSGNRTFAVNPSDPEYARYDSLISQVLSAHENPVVSFESHRSSVRMLPSVFLGPGRQMSRPR